MKTKTVTRYSCEFCSKRGFQRHAMKKHEAACIRNPDRWCPLCAQVEHEQAPIAELVGEIVIDHCVDFGTNEDRAFVASLGNLMQRCQGCPACALAAICQHPSKPVCAVEVFQYSAAKGDWYEQHREDP